MRTVDELRQQVAFERWATRAQVESLASVPAPSEELRAIAWHVLAGAENWLARIDGSTPSVSLQWVTPADGALATLLDAVERRFAAVASSLSDERLAATFAYRNSRGDAFESVVGDALEHLMLHGAEHRGQIALLVGREGGTPVETEYIFYLRSGPPPRR